MESGRVSEHRNGSKESKRRRRSDSGGNCQPYAAQCFGLQILKPHVFSSRQNSTRFIIVSKEEIYQEEAGKISVCFEIPHESGSLYNTLSHLSIMI